MGADTSIPVISDGSQYDHIQMKMGAKTDKWEPMRILRKKYRFNGWDKLSSILRLKFLKYRCCIVIFYIIPSKLVLNFKLNILGEVWTSTSPVYMDLVIYDDDSIKYYIVLLLRIIDSNACLIK